MSVIDIPDPILRRATLVVVACALLPVLWCVACVIGPAAAWDDYERAVRAAWGGRAK